MINYYFVTNWSFQAPIEKIWALVKEPEIIMSWWPEIQEFKIRRQNKDIVKGSMIDVVVRGIFCQFKFVLEIDEIEPKKELRLTSIGDLKGCGI